MKNKADVDAQREAIGASELPHDGSCLICGFAPCGGDLLCHMCRDENRYARLT